MSGRGGRFQSKFKSEFKDVEGGWVTPQNVIIFSLSCCVLCLLISLSWLRNMYVNKDYCEEDKDCIEGEKCVDKECNKCS